MNKTISINISGIIFNIEEDAYAILKNYLDTISSYFSESDGKQEIMEDIEARIAELLQERRPDSQVVTPIDVDEVMTIMGRPEDYVSVDEEPEFTSGSQRRSSQDKKLFLDLDNKIVGGVCAGIGAYFGWKPVWVRLVFVLCALGFWFFTVPLVALIYILMWIIVPSANTTAEKLQMHGEPVTVDTIKKKVDETLKSVSDGLPNVDQSTLSGARKGVSKGVDGLVSILGAIFSAVGRILGVLLLLSGILGVTALVAMALQPDAFMGGLPFSFAQMKDAVFNSTSQAFMFITGVVTQAVIPLVVIALIGIALAFRPKFSIRPIALTLFLCWIVGLIMLIVSSVGMGVDYRSEGEIETTQSVMTEKGTVTYIGFYQDQADRSTRRTSDIWMVNEDIVWANDDSFMSNDIDVRLRSTSEYSPMSVKVYRKARGKDNVVALERAENIVYETRLTADSLLLSKEFVCALQDKFRDQEVEVEIAIPVGHTVFFDQSTRRLWRYIETENEELRIRDVMDKKWTMGDEGFYGGRRKDDIGTPEPTKSPIPKAISAPDSPAV